MEFIVFVSTVMSDEQGRILLVQEKDPRVRGKYNLPGGHLKLGEKLVDAAIREVKEEVSLDIRPGALVGLYTTLGEHHFLHFVFSASCSGQTPVPQPAEILDCAWFSVETIANMDDDLLLNPTKLKTIVRDFEIREYADLAIITEFVTGGT